MANHAEPREECPIATSQVLRANGDDQEMVAGVINCSDRDLAFAKTVMGDQPEEDLCFAIPSEKTG